MKNKTNFSTSLATAIICSLISHQLTRADEHPTTIQITAKRFTFTPQEITLKRGVPVILQLTSTDRTHGFNSPALKIRTDVSPGKTTEVKLTPEKSGKYDFFCDVFCGGGHESMEGKFTVID